MKVGVNQFRINWRGRVFAARLSLFEALQTADLLAAVSGFDKPDAHHYLAGYKGIRLIPYPAKMAELPELPAAVKLFLKQCKAINGRGLKNKVPAFRPAFQETVKYHYGTGRPARSKAAHNTVYTDTHSLGTYFKPGEIPALDALLAKLRTMPKSARYDYLRDRGWPCRKARELSNI